MWDTKDDVDLPSLDFVEVGSTVDLSGGLGLIDVDAVEKRSMVSASEISVEGTCDGLCSDGSSGGG